MERKMKKKVLFFLLLITIIPGFVSAQIAAYEPVITIKTADNGCAAFSLTIKGRQKEVFLFAKRDGLQDLSLAGADSIHASEVDNLNGTYTYSWTGKPFFKYQKGEEITARFYTYDGLKQTFIPGPGVNEFSHSLIYGEDNPQKITAHAGENQSITDTDNSGYENVMLDGSKSYSPGGTIVSYSWSINNEKTAAGVKPEVTLSVGVHVIQLTVVDSLSDSATSSVTIEIKKGRSGSDLAAHAGADVTVQDNSYRGEVLVTLDGSKSSGVIRHYTWSKNGINIAGGPNPTLPFIVGTHVMELTVEDWSGNKSRDRVTINVVTPPETDGRFPVYFNNYTNGEYADDQIYVFGYAIVDNKWYYFTKNGSLAPMDASDNDDVFYRGRWFGTYSYTLDELKNFRVGSDVRGGRFYISLGKPIYMVLGSQGVGIPNVSDPDDINAETIFDFYEFTYVYKKVPFGGNTSRVDQFGFPISFRVEQKCSNFDETSGMNVTRADVYNEFYHSVDPEIHFLANEYRITAPRSHWDFDDRIDGYGSKSDYWDDYIDAVWESLRPGFSLTRLDRTFEGYVDSTDRIVFTKEGAGPFYIEKPSTVLALHGIAGSSMNITELEFAAELSAALNRGVAEYPEKWYSPEEYYKNHYQNDYAMVMHRLAINNKEYGFSYDDINSRSSVLIVDNPQPLDALTINIYW